MLTDVGQYTVKTFLAPLRDLYHEDAISFIRPASAPPYMSTIKAFFGIFDFSAMI